MTYEGNGELAALSELRELSHDNPRPASVGMPGRKEFLSYPSLVFTEMADGRIACFGHPENNGDADEDGPAPRSTRLTKVSEIGERTEATEMKVEYH